MLLRILSFSVLFLLLNICFLVRVFVDKLIELYGIWSGNLGLYDYENQVAVREFYLST